MNASIPSTSKWAHGVALLFAIVGTLCSTGMLWNSLETTGLAQTIGRRWSLTIVALFVVGSVPILLAIMVTLQRVSQRWPSRRLTMVAALLLAGMVVVQVLGYELLGSVRFLGSERDDIQYGAVRTLLDGHNPYSFIIPWGAQNSTLPGLLLLEVPFVATGTLFLMHFVVVIGLARVCRIAGWGSGPTVAVMAAMLAMPVVWRQSFPEGAELLTGDLLLVLVLASAFAAPRFQLRNRFLLYFLWGALLCAKASYFCVWPLLIRIVADKQGLREGLWAAVLSVTASLAIVVPFYAWAPDLFAPLETSDFVALYDRFVPGAGKAVLMALAASIIWAAGASAPNRDETWFLRAALIMAVPVLPIFILPLAHGEVFAPQWWPTYLLPSALLAAAAAALACKPTSVPDSASVRIAPVLQVVALVLASVLILLTPLGQMKTPDTLMSAIDEGRVAAVPALLAGRDVNAALGMRSPVTNGGRYGRETPLVQASRRGNLEIVDLLLGAGASARSGRNAYAMCAAKFYGWDAVVDRLAARGAPGDVWCGKRRARDMPTAG